MNNNKKTDWLGDPKFILRNDTESQQLGLAF